MTEKYKRILLVTDGSEAAKSAEQVALGLAKRDGAELVIVDTIRVQGMVEKWLVKNSEQMFQLFEKDKLARLESLAAKFSEQGVKTSSNLLHGPSSDEITRFVMREKCDLLIRYRKGADSKRKGALGNTALNLLRVCPCPVLLVAESQKLENPNILACVDIHDDEKVNRQIMHAANLLASGSSSGPSVLYCWIVYGHQMLRRRMNEESFEKLISDLRIDNEKAFDQFLAKYSLNRELEYVHIKHGDAELVIPKFVVDHQIDVTVMATTAPSSPAVKLLGSTIEHIIAELQTSILAVKPEGFVSPVTLADDQKDWSEIPAPILP